MSFEPGKGAVFLIDDATLALKDISAYINSADFNRDVDTPESTTFGNNDRTYIPGLAGATLSISGFWDSTATTGPDDVLQQNVGKATTSTFNYGPQGSVTGDIVYTGECILTSYVVSAPVDGIVSFTADFQVTGAVSRDTWPV
jgi:hypothetical protein